MSRPTVDRRSFLRLRTSGEERVVELSCERLFMRLMDARAGTGLEPSAGEEWGGEPPAELRTETPADLFRELDGRLAEADVLQIVDGDWLADDELRREVEIRLEAFRGRGGRVEDGGVRR